MKTMQLFDKNLFYFLQLLILIFEQKSIILTISDF
ncbi:MAG: hypothetical protein BWX49_01281 [Bacteroidetes bacterium ADurb.Bin008]|nr:MAG: hypothetical protein BWX49_01281 [Bacteroidetes bacterium ADurb.Bin008]